MRCFFKEDGGFDKKKLCFVLKISSGEGRGRGIGRLSKQNNRFFFKLYCCGAWLLLDLFLLPVLRTKRKTVFKK